MKYYKRLFLPHLSSPRRVDKKKLYHCAQMLSRHLLKSRSKFYPPLKENKEKRVHAKRSTSLYIFLLCLPLSLTGCMGIYEGGFECPAGTGVGCKSISDVNTLVNLGEIPKVQGEESPISKPEIWYAPSMRGASEKAACPSCTDEQDKLKGQKEFEVENVSISI